MVLGRLPAQQGMNPSITYPQMGMGMMPGMGPYGPQMAPAGPGYANAGMGAFSPAYEQTMRRNRPQQQQGNSMTDMMFSAAANNWMSIPGLFGGSGAAGTGAAGAGAGAAAGGTTGAIGGAGAAGAAGAGAAAGGTTAAGGLAAAGSAGAGGAATAGTTAAGGLAAAAPAMMWALPFIAGAAVLSADAYAGGAKPEDIGKWWLGPVGNAIDGDWDSAAKGGARMAGGPFSLTADIIDERPWEETASGVIGGPVGYALHDLIAGKGSKDIIKRFSGFGKKKK